MVVTACNSLKPASPVCKMSALYLSDFQSSRGVLHVVGGITLLCLAQALVLPAGDAGLGLLQDLEFFLD